jgi:hypothetical protein
MTIDSTGAITLNGNQINWGGAGNAYTYGGASIVSTLGAAGTFQFRNSSLSPVVTIDSTGAITASGNVNIGANSLVGTYSGTYNDGKWLTGSDNYGSFYISPYNASFAFAPPAATPFLRSSAADPTDLTFLN